MRMDSPILSVIIPTHKRPQILRRTLEYIERQTIVDQIEVIVVNDESEKLKVKSEKFGLRILNVPPCHQGVARNRGVEGAKGKYVLFIGDDIFLAPDACARHIQAHSPPLPVGEGLGVRASRAVLGFTTWDPAVGITPVMEWLEFSGWQFGYPMIAPYAHQTIPSSIQHRFTYTSHISLPTEIAKKFPFREDVTLYGWEDIEWGWRLKNAGVKLFYQPDARALHHHHMTLEDSLKRMETLGRSAVMIEKIALGLDVVPKGFKKLKYQIASLLPGMRGMHSKAYMQGIGKF